MSADPGNAPIDAAFLKDLSDDPVAMRELIDSFLQQSAVRIENIRSAVAAGAANELMRMAHTGAGSSGMYGMGGLEAVFRELERKAKAGDLSDAPRLCEQLQTEFQRIETYWKTYQQQGNS